MADEQDLVVKIVLDDGAVVNGFLNVQKSGQKTASNIENAFENLTTNLSASFSKIASSLIAIFAVSKLVDFIKSATLAAAAGEKAFNQFAQALASIGQFTPKAAQEFANYAQQLQKTTGINSDLILSNAALLVSLDHLSGDKLKRTTQAALDLATVMQGDVNSAFDLISKAANGVTTGLVKQGFRIDETLPKYQRLEQILTQIETRFSGLAQTRLNTFDGALTNLGNSFEEFEKSIGKSVVESGSFRTLINELATIFVKLSESVDNFRKNNGGDLFKNAILSALEFVQVMNEYIFKPLALGFNFVKLGILSIQLAIDVVLTAAYKFGQLLVEALVFPVRDAASLLGALIGTVNKDLGDKLIAQALRIASDITTPMQNAFLEQKLVMQETFDDIEKLSKDTWTNKLTGDIDAYIQKLKGMVAAAKSETTKLANNTDLDILDERWKKLNESITTSVRDGIVKTISSGLQKIGENLAKGEGAFENFGQAIIGVLGDLAINVGTLLIGMGLGIDQLKVALATFDGFSLVAAGAALIVLGGALKALSGGLGSNASVGGGVNAAPTTTTEPTPTQDLTRTEPNTNVQVIVQGDILDSNETGSRIVDLINTAFDKKGVVINRGAIA